MKLIEVVPHPKIRGEWLVRSVAILPYPVWYKDKQQAVSYAEWLARDNSVEIRVHEPAALVLTSTGPALPQNNRLRGDRALVRRLRATPGSRWAHQATPWGTQHSVYSD
jgi:hypothetical protein